MRKKILSVVIAFTILFSVIGCGGSDTPISKTNETKVKIAFESQKGTVFEKVSDITKVLLDVKKDDAFIYEEKSARKINGSWNITLNLNSNNAPYSFTTRAYKGDELLYKGDFISTETLPTSLLLTLDEVRADTSFSLLPSLKKIETSFLAPIRGEDTVKKIRMKFTIVNLQSDSVDYSLLAIRKAINVKGQLVEVGDAGSFNPNSGALNFTNENELIFESVYTQPVNPPDESTSSDVFTGGTKDFISTSLLLTNSKGNVVTIPFTLPTYEEQTVSINFPPEVQKVDVLDEGEEHTLKVILSDADNATFTYEWEVLTGSTIVGSTATQNALKLEAYDVTSNNSLCVRVKVSDVHGASTKVGYCLHGTGLVREGNVVTDVVRKVQWQDDEAVKTVKKQWMLFDNYYGAPYSPVNNTSGDTSTTYCNALELEGFSDWRVPSYDELHTIADSSGDPMINPIFKNIREEGLCPNRFDGDDYASCILYTTSSEVENIDEVGSPKGVFDFKKQPNRNYSRYYYSYLSNYKFTEKIYVRCIRDIVTTPTSDNAVLKKTGQTKSYNQDGDEVTDGSVKDDGFYQKGLISNYTRDNIAKTVSDHITKLVWQDDEDVKNLNLIKTWSEAKAYCEAKENGWRLPTIQELNSIVEYSKEKSLNNYFINIIDRNRWSTYWSSTIYIPYLVYPEKAWAINFNGGTQHYRDNRTGYYVRCVRTEQ